MSEGALNRAWHPMGASVGLHLTFLGAAVAGAGAQSDCTGVSPRVSGADSPAREKGELMDLILGCCLSRPGDPTLR